MKSSTIKEKIENENKSLPLRSVEELEFIATPVGKAVYKANEDNIKEPEEPDKKLKDTKWWSKKIKCDICGEYYTYSNSGNHKRTKIHKAHEKFHNKMKKFIMK